MIYDVIIIGSGPAGLTAAIYTTRANVKTLIIGGSKWGGQLMLTTLVENFPGFPEGIQGPDLMTAMRKQAENHGAQILEADFTEGDFSLRPFKVTAGGQTYEGKSIIIATGADTRWLDVPGEKEFIGRGVSSCAPCDAPFFKEKNVVVVGGGDSAMEEALVLSRLAKSITVIHRRDALRASHILQERAKANPKIKFIFNAEVVEVLGQDPSTLRQAQGSGQDKVTGIKLKNNQTGQVLEMPIEGVFVAIGHLPNTRAFKGVEIDDGGYIVVADHTKTNVPGVFVAGDVHDSKYKQAVTAAGFGCAAALEAEKWLRDN